MTSAFAKQQELSLFSEEELASLNPLNIPEHIAIIMDGNRRWAKKEGLPPMAGHWRGAEILSKIVRCSAEIGIKTLTVYAFSTENWKRPPLEVKALMRLFKSHLIRQTPVMIEEGVRFSVIGDCSKFSRDLQKTLKETEEATSDGRSLDLVVALNYGARDEMKRAMENILEDCLAKKISKEDLSEDLIGTYLDTSKWKDPDLLIRPSGENRLSNFLLWQISYSEIYVTETLWPDFTEKDLLDAILEYQKRELRLGK